MLILFNSSALKSLQFISSIIELEWKNDSSIIFMSYQANRKHLNTQPRHESLSSEAHTTARNKSEMQFREPASSAPSLNPWLYRHNNQSRVSSANKSSRGGRDTTAKMRSKYYMSQRSQLTKEPYQLYSPFIGLKVRRARQTDDQFHSSFTRDQILNYFSTQPAQGIKKKPTNHGGWEAEIKKDRQTHKQIKMKAKQRSQLRVPTQKSQKEDRIPSQLSGWKVEDDYLKQSSLEGQSYQIISNYPSINAGFTHEVTCSTPLQQEASSNTENPYSGLDLPDYSLKIVPPSQMNSSVKDVISIKVINENILSNSQLEPSKHSLASCAIVNSKHSINTNKSNLRLSRHTIQMSKRTHDSLPSNKQNECLPIPQRNQETASEKHTTLPSPSRVKQQSKIQLSEKLDTKTVSKSSISHSSQGEVHSIKALPASKDKLGKRMLDCSKMSVSYSEDYVCSQKLDESEGIRVTEREETRALKFDRNNPKQSLKLNQNPNSTPSNHNTPPITPPPSTVVIPSMKKGKPRKSVVVQKIEQFGSQCKNFFSNLADKINPFHEEKPKEEESELGESILALRTLNSRPDLNIHYSPRELHVQIRQATMMETQGWGMESALREERIQTIREIRTTKNDFSSEVRIALSNKALKESFYSQQYMYSQGEERKKGSKQALQDIIADQTGRCLQQDEDSLLDRLCGSKPKPTKNQIKDEVAQSLDQLEEYILGKLHL